MDLIEIDIMSKFKYTIYIYICILYSNRDVFRVRIHVFTTRIFTKFNAINQSLNLIR